MKRTKLRDRILPNYTKGEEMINMVTHIVGGGFGIMALVLCVVMASVKGNICGVVTGAVYGGSMVLLYTASSIYHGLNSGIGKKVMQIIDHCSIYLLIAGTYTPILLCSLRQVAPVTAWVLFGFVWGCTIFAATLTAIDIKKYEKFSMLCYIAMGWCIVFDISSVRLALGDAGFGWLLAGGIAYTLGAVLYGIGKKKKYMHSVFHMFTVAGSVLQFICIIFFVI